MSGAIRARSSRLRDRIDALRTDVQRRRLVVLGGLLLGLALASVHWLGLVLGGALVAFPAPSIPRGLGHGLGMGVLVLLVFAGRLALQGALGPALSTGVIGGIGVAVGLGLPLLGALVRGVV